LRAAVVMKVDFLGAKRDALHASPEPFRSAPSTGFYLEQHFGLLNPGYAAVRGMETDQ